MGLRGGLESLQGGYDHTPTPVDVLMAAGFPVTWVEQTATSGATVVGQTIARDDGGVGVNGDGVAQDLALISSAGTRRTAFRVSTEWSDATDGSEDSEVAFLISIAGSLLEGMRFRASGVDSQIVSPFAFILSPNADIDDGLRITTVANDTYVIPQQVANQFYLGNTVADPSVNLNRGNARAFDIIPLGTTITSNTPGNWIDMASNVVIDVAPTGSLGGFVSLSGEVRFRQAGSAFGAGNLFKIQGTIKNESGSLVSIGSQYTFVNVGTYQADGVFAQSNFFHRICLFQPTWSVINGATMAVTTANTGGLINPTVGAGVTITNMRDWEWSVGTITGTATDRAAIYFPDIAGGSSSTAGIRSLIASGATRRFLNHTGTAQSDLGGALGLGSGATIDVLLSRGAADRLDLASGDSMRFISGSLQFVDVNAQIDAPATGVMHVDVDRIAFGPTTPGATDNNFALFAPPSGRVASVGGDYSDMNFSAAGNLDVNGQALTNVDAWRIGSLGITLSAGSITDIAALRIPAMTTSGIGTALTSALFVGARTVIDGSANLTPNDDTLAADQNNYQGHGIGNSQRSVLRIDGGAANRNITGFDAAISRDHDTIWVINTGTTNNIVLQDENVGSAAANRIISPTAGDLTLTPDETAMLWYDDTATRWRILFHTGT